MDQELDPHMKRILLNATKSSDNGQKLKDYHFPIRQPPSRDWSLGNGPWRLKQNQDLHYSSSYGMVDPYPQAIKSADIAYKTPSRISRDREATQEEIPLKINNLDTNFRLEQNPRQYIASNQLQLRTIKPQYPGMPVRTTSAMAFHQPPHPLRAEPPFFELQGLPNPNPNEKYQFQLRRQEAYEPSNLYSHVQSPTSISISAASSSWESSTSSPSTRINLRRVKSRPVPTINPHLNYEIKSSNSETPELSASLQYTSSPSNHGLQTLDLRHAPMIVQGIQLVSPHELPDRIRQVFPYELFNAIQSKCFAPIYNTNDNVVVSAPTGSGKTALLELAVCNLVVSHPHGQFKIVYLAPTKSLCSERFRDWQKKFSHLNLPCAELTGDTSHYEMARVRTASIIITTPEKWDSITRNWSDHHRLVQMVRLFLIDEVHILKDIRGATLEAVVSRMKAMGANVRFVTLSATVPNSEDVALWLGKDHTNQHLPAHRETFGESFRPVRLRKHVHGYDATCNDYAFEKFLDGKLTSLLQKYTHKKPIMIFCFTRKSCEATASILSEWWKKQKIEDRAWHAPLNRTVVVNKELQSLVASGVAFHHAGLDAQDRRAIETGYLKGDINLICCTSTLAIGVNLPCHMVVLKGTVGFQDGFLREYSDLEVMQMLGRAGRPQFDDSAVAIIMTRVDKAERYKKMISGQDILESTLHLNLIEHLNSEISLGSVKDLHQAKTWITKTFLSVRMRQNPRYYQITGVSESGDTDQRLEKVCERDINLLQEHNLVKNEEKLTCTEYGEAMCKYMVQFETMKLLLGIPKQAKTEQILEIICEAIEFKDLRIKPSERACLRKLNNSAFIKYPINQTVSTTAHKVSLLIQVQLGGIQYPEEKEFGAVRRQFLVDKNIIFERIQRLIRCVIECKAKNYDAVSTRHALDFARSLSAGFWDNSNLQLRQIPQIGPVAHRKLSEAKINTIHTLITQDTASIERVLSKNPPFGKKIKDILINFPRLKVFAEIKRNIITKQKEKPQVLVRAILGYENNNVPVWNNRKPNVVFMAETSIGKLAELWRGNISKLNNGFEITFTVALCKVEEAIKCWIACEDIVGTTTSVVLRHDIPVSNFPALTPEPEEQNTSLRKTSSFDDSDEFGNGEFSDEEMLAVVKRLEKPTSNYDSDDLSDIDKLGKEFNLIQHLKNNQSVTGRQREIKASTRMRNGKWTCQHDCRNGGVRKNGQTCKHRCCHEGIDKPPKVKQTKQAVTISQKDNFDDIYNDKPIKKISKEGLSSKISHKRSSNVSPKYFDDVEIIDLSIDSPDISDTNDDEYEISDIHNSDIQQDCIFIKSHSEKKFEDLITTKINSEFSQTVNSKQIDKMEILDNKNLSPSEMLILEREQSYSNKSDLYEASSTTFAESPKLHLETDDLEAESTFTYMGGTSQDMESKPNLSQRPRSNQSPADGDVNVELLDGDYDTEKKSYSPKLKKILSSDAFNDVYPKRRGLYSTEIHESKRQKSTQTDLAPKIPTWVNDFDSELINELKDFVDFIE
ncbi:ATP-dependent DNA helicase [Podosphaera aphanis]|nr:ATP-dependent DNA helicase [Podosphaera aphanis]